MVGTKAGGFAWGARRTGRQRADTIFSMISAPTLFPSFISSFSEIPPAQCGFRASRTQVRTSRDLGRK